MKASQSLKYSVLQENVIPPSKVGSTIVILTQTLGEEFPYTTLGLRPRVEFGNSSPQVWIRITILLPPSEGGMYQTWVLNRLIQFGQETPEFNCFDWLDAPASQV